ncbi:MAG: hypothetical protein U7127_02610 [Phormidium sp.]
MGIRQWSRCYISASICHKYNNIKPGEYLVMYDGSTGEFIIKDPIQGKIVYNEQINSLEDLAYLAPNKEASEAIQRLQPKKQPSLGGGYNNHHIILHHLWDECEITIRAERYGVLKKDGNENLMPLPDEFHAKNHGLSSQYSRTLRHHLEKRWNQLVDAGLDEDPNAIREALLEIIEFIREELTILLKEKGKTIRNFYMRD